VTAAEIAAKLGDARLDGKDWRCRCPVCGKSALNIKDNPNGRWKLLVKCWSGCTGKAIRDELKSRKLYNGAGNGATPSEDDAQREAREAAEAAARKQKIDNALDTWRNSMPVAEGSLADVYLASRLLLQRPISAVLRFAPAIFHPKENRKFPALIALVQHERKGAIGIHAIALNALDPASKLTIEDRKWSRGAVKGGAVRLFPAGPELAIGEGVEDCLAFQQATEIPAWAALGHTGLSNFVPPPVETTPKIILIGDQDDPGRKAVADKARELAKKGYAIRIARPLVGKDLNDALLARGPTEPICSIEEYHHPGNADLLPFSEQWLGLELVAQYFGQMRYTPLLNRWDFWNGQLWRRDEKLGIFSRAQQICREASKQAKSEEDQATLLRANTRANVVSLAREHPLVAATPDEWNTNPWLIGTPGGTVDLRDGKLRPGDPAEMITRSVVAVPGDSCPIWFATISAIFRDDQEVIKFAQRLAGYCLTAKVIEEVLLFLWGLGGNGKGTFLETLLYCIGDYGTTIPVTTLIETKHHDHPTEIAKLHGMRLAVASETDNNTRWNTARLKLLSGGDKLTGRFMRADFFEFEPTHKTFISGNHKPSFGRVDDAIRRRLILWPFEAKFPKPDKKLKEKLKAEAPGILAWMIQGCLEWQRVGLDPPYSMVAATKAYLDEADDVSRFIDECCVLDASARRTTKELYRPWVEWCKDAGLHPGSSKAFTERLKERFPVNRGSKNLNYLSGLRISWPDE
jgi:putative DNA primase/helicase